MEHRVTKKRPTLCINLIHTFTEKEITAFKKFIDSPYFNMDKKLKPLLKAIEKFTYKNDDYHEKIKIRVYNYTFKAQLKTLTKKEKTALNFKMNALLRLAEKFLCQQKTEQDEWTKLDLLYPQLIDRKQYYLFNKHFRKDDKALNTKQIIDEQHYDKLYKLYAQKVKAQFETGELGKEDYVQKMIDFFDLNYLTNKLSDFTTIKSLIDLLTKNYDLGSYKKIDSLISFKRFSKNNKLKLLKSYYNFVNFKTEFNYKEFVLRLNQAEEQTSNQELQHLFITAINYCTQMIRSGKHIYYENMFTHYNSMIKKNLLLQNGLIEPLVFTNIVTLACRLEHMQWSKEFIKDYKNKIRKNIQKEIYSYVLGIITFAEKKFDIAHQYFYQVHKTNTSLDFNARIYIKVYV